MVSFDKNIGERLKCAVKNLKFKYCDTKHQKNLQKPSKSLAQGHKRPEMRPATLPPDKPLIDAPYKHAEIFESWYLIKIYFFFFQHSWHRVWFFSLDFWPALKQNMENRCKSSITHVRPLFDIFRWFTPWKLCKKLHGQHAGGRRFEARLKSFNFLPQIKMNTRLWLLAATNTSMDTNWKRTNTSTIRLLKKTASDLAVTDTSLMARSTPRNTSLMSEATVQCPLTTSSPFTRSLAVKGELKVATVQWP